MSRAVAGAKPTLSGGARTVRFAYHIRCGRRKLHGVQLSEKANDLVYTQREHSANITGPPKAYEHSEPAKKVNILEFDCRGLEFTEFKPEGEWLAEGVDSNTKFTSIDLSEGEWFDYDEKAGDEVSIKELKWEIRRA